MLPVAIVAALVVAAIVVLLYQGLALGLAAQMPRLDPSPPGELPTDLPKVSVVVAARNEELDLPATLETLAAQDYPNLDVVVVDGASTDGTRRVVEAFRGRPVRLVDEPPLPAGWVGKSWGCWTGAQATDGEWLLFLDADVRLAPTAVRTTLLWAERERARLATVAPRVETVGFWERTVLPFYVQMVLTYFRAPRTNLPTSRAALVNGQFWLVRRSDYVAQGGHAAVRGEILEDVAIGRRFRSAGLPIRLAWAPELARTRMYRDRHEMFEGILKNLHGFRFSAARQAGRIAGLIGLFWLPLGLWAVGWATGSLLLAALGGVLVVALFGKHVAFARSIGAPAAYGLLFPVAVGFYVVALATSLARGLQRRAVTWKGRAYPLRP